jgi:phosphinothricin acetyltransferase
MDDLRTRPVHAVVACIALPNEASVALHEKLGFRQAGHMREVGWKFDRWIDVGYWELHL